MTICEELFAMRDESYARFQAKLIPTVDACRVIGVRTPMLRKYAEKISGSARAQAFLGALPHTYYDENNLHGALIEQISDYDEALAAVEAFLPYVDNWATCDLFCPRVLRQAPARLRPTILRWLQSDRLYTVRFALVRLTFDFLDAPTFDRALLDAAAEVPHTDYYVQMAQAWLFCEALVKQYDATLPYLAEHRLPTWVHNKAIGKAVESYRFSKETKDFLKTLKRKGEAFS